MPTLDFFQQQEDSQKAARRIMLLFPVAVCIILLVVCLFFAAFFSSMEANTPSLMEYKENPDKIFISGIYQDNEILAPIEPHKTFTECMIGYLINPWFLTIILTITLGSIILATWAKILEISTGSWVQSKIRNGICRPLYLMNHKEKRLLNVAEEMSIAAGIDTPLVLLLEREMSINTFIAQNGQNGAALFVTKGCLNRLNRDELQAIVAHELSHVVNGNLKNEGRMVGLLSGISILYELGQDIYRMNKYVPFIQSPGCLLFLVHLIIAGSLLAIGYLGVLLARLIKKASNRHRAVMADAATIQFTRSTALSRVLLKIAVSKKKKNRRIYWFNPESISHLCFTDPFGRVRWNLFSAHPSLKNRAKLLNRREPKD